MLRAKVKVKVKVSTPPAVVDGARVGLALFALMCGLSQVACFDFEDLTKPPKKECKSLGSCTIRNKSGNVCQEGQAAPYEGWGDFALDTFKESCAQSGGVYSEDPCSDASCGCCSRSSDVQRMTECVTDDEPKCFAEMQKGCAKSGGVFHLAGQAPDLCEDGEKSVCQLDDTITAVEPATIVSTWSAGADSRWQFATSGYVDYRVSGSGVVTVSLEGKQYLRARVKAVSGQDPNVSAAEGVSGGPLPTAAGPDTIRIAVPHSPSVRPQALTVRFESESGESPPDKSVILATLQDGKDVLPIASTFVKGVSVADGHLVRQFEDLRVAGREWACRSCGPTPAA
jgi:hypothetical protein